MRVDHATMREHNGAKIVPFAAMRVHEVTIGTSNAAMGALITAKRAFNAATLRGNLITQGLGWGALAFILRCARLYGYLRANSSTNF
jgi:hypothetical protein